MGALARVLGVDRTTIAYHVRALERDGQLIVVRKHGFTLLALPDQPVRPARELAADRLLAALQARGGEVSHGALRAIVESAAPRTLRRALRALREQGLIECVQGPGATIVRLRALSPSEL